MKTEMLWVKQPEIWQTVWCLKWYQRAIYKHEMYKYVEWEKKMLVTDRVKEAGELSFDWEIGIIGVEPE